MHLYRRLTKYINLYYTNLKDDNLFFRRTFNGQITVAEFAAFIRNVTFLTAHSPLVLRLAYAAAREQGRDHLADFFAKKIQDGDGHHRWGEADLEGIRRNFKVPSSVGEVTDEMKRYMDDVQQMIREDPMQLFVYILFAEYFTVVAGPEFLNAVNRANAIPKEFMSLIGNHAEADKEHIEDWAKEAQDLGLGDRDYDRCREVLDRVMAHYDMFTESVSRRHLKTAQAA